MSRDLIWPKLISESQGLQCRWDVSTEGCNDARVRLRRRGRGEAGGVLRLGTREASCAHCATPVRARLQARDLLRNETRCTPG